jgi:hypothetical protein
MSECLHRENVVPIFNNIFDEIHSKVVDKAATEEIFSLL